MEKWQHIEYDIIDVGAADAFSADYKQFMDVMRELERRLCQVVLAAFDDCATMSATFKLLDSFEGLLERDVIAQVRPLRGKCFCNTAVLLWWFFWACQSLRLLVSISCNRVLPMCARI